MRTPETEHEQEEVQLVVADVELVVLTAPVHRRARWPATLERAAARAASITPAAFEACRDLGERHRPAALQQRNDQHREGAGFRRPFTASSEGTGR
ncbi:MAG: hypothetical protein U0167_14170 [bacterium]